jgi:hypothetical protein
MVSEVPPTKAPAVPTKVMPVPAEIDEVAAEYVSPVRPAACRPAVIEERLKEGVVRRPVAEIDVVPVPPKKAVFEEKTVEDAPPLNERSVVVAFDGKRYANAA